MIKKIVKIFARLIGGIVSLAIIFYLVVLGINWRDEQPSEQAQRFAEIYSKRPHVADERNGFFYLVGFWAEEGKDPMTAGLAMVERAKANPSGTRFSEYSHPDYPQSDFLKNGNAVHKIPVCASLGEECQKEIVNKLDANVTYSPSDTVLLERYRTLTAFPAWQSIYPQGFNGPQPPFSRALIGQKLSLFEIWQQAESRGAKRTAELLDSDARFWQGILTSSDSLNSNMLAIMALKRNIFWTNLVLRRLSEKKMSPEVPSTWLLPINDEERSMEHAFAGEMSIAEGVLKNASDDELFGKDLSFVDRIVSRLIRPLFLPQATINLRAEDWSLAIESLNVPYDQLPAAVKKQNELSTKKIRDGMGFPHILYNPTGKAFDAWATPDNAGYMVAASDLEGQRRALLATLELRSEYAPRERMSEALVASPYHNPYTNQPFEWDEATSSVAFQGLSDDSKRGRFLLAF